MTSTAAQRLAAELRPFADPLMQLGIVDLDVEMAFATMGDRSGPFPAFHHFTLDARVPEPDPDKLSDIFRSIHGVLADHWPQGAAWRPPKAHRGVLDWRVEEFTAELIALRDTEQVMERRTRKADASELSAPVARHMDFAQRTAAAHNVRLASCTVELIDSDGEVEERGVRRFTLHGGSAKERMEAGSAQPKPLRGFPQGKDWDRLGQEEIHAWMMRRYNDPNNPTVRGVFQDAALCLSQTGPADENQGVQCLDGADLCWRWLAQFRTPAHPQWSDAPIVIKSERIRHAHETLKVLSLTLPKQAVRSGNVLPFRAAGT